MLEIQNLNKSFIIQDSSYQVLENLSFSVQEGDFFVILGQSGCGKSTLLRLIGGFDKPDSGVILLDGRPITSPSKDVMMVFQSFDQLFPWYTLRQNLIYALKKVRAEIPVPSITDYADHYLGMAGLQGFEDSYPHQLSGGMKQRGALARALCLKPKILLMDEPFSSLDYVTKQSSYTHIRELAVQTGCTILLVTHDIEEAMMLGSSIAVFPKGERRFGAICSNVQPGPQLKQELEQALQGHL